MHARDCDGGAAGGSQRRRRGCWVGRAGAAPRAAHAACCSVPAPSGRPAWPACAPVAASGDVPANSLEDVAQWLPKGGRHITNPPRPVQYTQMGMLGAAPACQQLPQAVPAHRLPAARPRAGGAAPRQSLCRSPRCRASAQPMQCCQPDEASLWHCWQHPCLGASAACRHCCRAPAVGHP